MQGLNNLNDGHNRVNSCYSSQRSQCQYVYSRAATFANNVSHIAIICNMCNKHICTHTHSHTQFSKQIYLHNTIVTHTHTPSPCYCTHSNTHTLHTPSSCPNIQPHKHIYNSSLTLVLHSINTTHT